MIQVTAQTRIFIATSSIDFRCGIESLGGVIKNKFNKNPMEGALFVFTNKRRDGLKFLVFDGQGYWLMHKRFSQGKLSWWPGQNPEDEISPGLLTLDHRNLLLLIYNGDPRTVKFQTDWQKVA